MRQEAEIVILGGGLAGLSCGFLLADKGKKPVVIERERTVGGLCRSFRREGFTFDLGGHRFLPRDDQLATFVARLFNPGEMHLGHRKSHIYLNSKFLNYPPDLANILKELGLQASLQCLAEGLFLPVKRKLLKKVEVSLQDWILHRFGKKLYNIYFGPYSEKLWGREPSRISRDWAPQRIPVANVRQALLSILNQKKEGRYARHFLYPLGGIGQIPSRLGEKIRGRGGRVFTGWEVKSILEKHGGFLVVAGDREGRRNEFFSKNLVSTIPLPDLVNRYRPAPPLDILNSARNLHYRSIRFLNIMIDLPRITDNTWLYIPEKDYLFFRIQEFPNWDQNNSPQGQTSLTLEIACDRGDRVWTMNEQELLARCLTDLKKMGLDVKNKVLGHFSTFAEHSYPVYALDYRHHREKILRFLESKKNLALSGRQGFFTYINMDKVMESGFGVAESLIRGEKPSRIVEDDRCLEKNIRLTQ
jgi:protoporphyrinogen oxidase